MPISARSVGDIRDFELARLCAENIAWCVWFPPKTDAAFIDMLQVIDLTDDFEGSIIRVFRRLEELLRQLSQARGTSF